MAREKRAQWWLPSFAFVVAAAVACGGTVVGEEPFEPSSSGAGGTSFAGNPPPITHGGRMNTDPPPIARGGYANEAGAPSISPGGACPPFLPPDGSACLSPTRGGPNECAYATDDACTTILAWCMGGAWSLSEYSIICSNGFAGAAGEGGSAGQAPIGEAGSAGEGPAPVVVYCPQAVPTAASSCYKPSSVASYRCDYALACGVYEATCNGYWQLAFRETNSCSAGAAGN